MAPSDQEQDPLYSYLQRYQYFFIYISVVLTVIVIILATGH